MKPERDIAAIAARAANHLVRYPWQVWYFGDTVGLEGLLAATALTGDESYRWFGYGLVRGWMARSAPPRRYDFTAPGLAMVELLRHLDDIELRGRLLDLATWQGMLTRAGGQVLVDPLDAFWVWVDCMQFQGPFFAALGSLTGDERWYREADRFLLAHAGVLRDGNGLYSQIYDVISGETNGIHWGRGQGWAMLGLWQTWLRLPDAWPARPQYAMVLRDLLETMLPYQTDDGHWRTIVDDPSAMEESSIAAFYVATVAPALRAGVVEGTQHVRALQRAWEAVTAAVDADGLLRGVSADTLPGTPEEYKSIPMDVDVPWGQGPLLLALEAMAVEGRNDERVKDDQSPNGGWA